MRKYRKNHKSNKDFSSQLKTCVTNIEKIRRVTKVTEIQDLEKEKPKNVTFRPLLPCSSEINLLSVALLFSKNVLAY